MWTSIYDLVVYMIGPVPVQLEFVYAFGVIFLFLIVVMCVVCPFWIASKVFN